MPVVLAVGLDRGCLDTVRQALGERAEEVTLVVQRDSRGGRSWISSCDEAPQLIIAAFHEPDAWGLSALLAGACSRTAGSCGEVLLISDVPCAALPVLITDVCGLRTVAAGSTSDLRTHLDQAIAAWSALALS